MLHTYSKEAFQYLSFDILTFFLFRQITTSYHYGYASGYEKTVDANGWHYRLIIFRKSLLFNFVYLPFLRSHLSFICCCTHPKVMTGNGQLTRGAFIINDFLRNPHFKTKNFLRLVSCKIYPFSIFNSYIKVY